jgi:hypothetical protein
MKNLVYILPLFLTTVLTGCYTQVATQQGSDSPDYTTVETYDSEGYYYDEETDSGYYSEDGEIIPDDATIINNYYYDEYDPWYRRYYGYYYPSFTIGIGVGFYYYPYYWSSWCGYSWYYPYPYYYYPGYYGGYYGYCPSYYSYNYYCDPYPYYYSDGYYKTRSDYTTRLRNNTGSRGNGNRLRDPIINPTTITSTDRVRDFTNSGRDLTVNNNGNPKTRNSNTLGISTVNTVSDIDKTRSKDIKRNDQIGMVDRDVKKTRTEKQLGLNVSKDTNRKKYLGLDTQNKNDRTLGLKNPKTKNQTTDKITGRTGNTYNVPKKDFNTNKVDKNRNTTNKNYTKQPKQYTSPKSNNTPKSYSPPQRTNSNNSPKSYSPPKNNSYSPPRTTTPPRNSGNSNMRSSGTNRSRR